MTTLSSEKPWPLLWTDDKFVELFGSEYSKVANTGFVPEGSIGYVETPQNKRDLDLAKQYLAEAGASDTDGDGILELNGKKLSVEASCQK